MSDSCRIHREEEVVMDRREALRRTAGLALGGVLGSLVLSSCRAPMVYRDFPQPGDRFQHNDPPTGYLVDPRYCTRCGDCLRVCRCDAVGGYTFDANNKKKSPAKNEEESDKHQCWIYIDLCCGCGKCFRVCDVDAIIPCYGPDRVPAKPIPDWKNGMPWGFLKSEYAAPGAHCCVNGAEPEKK